MRSPRSLAWIRSQASAFGAEGGCRVTQGSRWLPITKQSTTGGSLQRKPLFAQKLCGGDCRRLLPPGGGPLPPGRTALLCVVEESTASILRGTVFQKPLGQDAHARV